MDFKQIVIAGYKSVSDIKNEDRKTFLVAYFTSKVRVAERDDFILPKNFLKGCSLVIESYHREIKYQYEKRLHKDDLVILSVENGSGINFNGEIVKDKKDPRIQDCLNRILNDKKDVEKKGNKHFEYTCKVTDKGEITKEMWDHCYTLESRDVDELEEAIKQALSEPPKGRTERVKRVAGDAIPFTAYLHHDNKTALLLKLHELMDGKQAKVVAITIKALEELALLAGYDSKKLLYDAISKEFSVKISSSGVNKFLNPYNKLLRNEDIRPIKEILQKVI